MSRSANFKCLIVACAAGWALSAQSLLACAACFGQSDSPLAAGMNWGIFTLLGVVVTVLSGVASFGIYLAKRSAAVAASTAAAPAEHSTEKV